MKIHRFYNHNEILSFEFKEGNIEIHGFENFEGSLTETNGLYQLINDELLAVFSHEEKNYLYVKDKLIVITTDIIIQYYCEQNDQQLSWIKIYDKNYILYEIEYKNNEEPYIDMASGFDDWDTVNFAYYLGAYINKVKENPHTVFSNS
nr:hypothetical protein [Flavobacterium sp. ASV13]